MKTDVMKVAGTIVIDGHSGIIPPGASLFEAAEALGITVPTSCHKQGKCRECLLEIESGAQHLEPPTPQESHLRDNFRLACRTHLCTPGEIRCRTLQRGTLRIETETTPLAATTEFIDPAVTRKGDQIFMDGRPIARWQGTIHGLALDLGTTTIVLRLVNLESGQPLATRSFENPQRFAGSDIMARIHFDGQHGGKLLQRTLLGYLTRAIHTLPVDPVSIFEIVVVGNPTMRDLFFGYDVQPIGIIPYRSVTETAFREGRASTTSIHMPARRLRLPVHPEARVYGLPVIASHVGADAAACLLATGIPEREQISAVLDIGTNTEAILGNRHHLMAASCPAGPAFEGGGVACGMPALDGAIERISITATGEVQFRVIGNLPPLGICGSGLVDLLAELLRTGIMNQQGRLQMDHGFMEIEPQARIRLTEADINELAQAKGANAAGLRILAESYGIPLQQIDRLYLAGGFARHLNVEAACRIGLIPDLPRERIIQAGNAALQGATMALLSRSRREWLEQTVKKIQHVRLETHPQFFDLFVEGCQFMPFGSSNG